MNKKIDISKIIIIGIAITLRLILLNQSLWLDESLEGLALMGKMGPILEYAITDFQPPLYHLLGIAWTHLAGYSEIALRTPSLLAGIMTVWFVIRLGELVGRRKTGLIAGILAATNPLLIYYSQEGRTYAMTTFFVIAGFYYLLQILKNNKSYYHTYSLYFIFTLGALWTSYLAWIVIGLQSVYLLFCRQWRPLAANILAFLTLIMWVPFLIQSLHIGLSTAGNTPAWGTVVGGISWKAIALTWVKMNIGRIGFDNKVIYGSLVALLLLIHGIVLKKLQKINPLFYVWLLGPVVIASVISLFVPVYAYFRVLFIIPAYLVLLALGLAVSRPYMTKLLVFSNILFLILFWFSPRFHRENWRSLVVDFGTNATYALPSRNQMAPLLYYGVPSAQILEPKTPIIFTENEIVYIRYVEDVFDAGHQGIRNLTEAGYTIVGSKAYAGIQVDTYENNN